MMKKYRRKLNAAAVILTLCVCTGIVLYAKEKVEESVTASAPIHNSTVIVLDAGHDAYVLT